MSLAYRIIARLDIKGPNLIKGIQFEGLRVLGNPAQFAKKYADEGADELLYIDTVASLYGRNQLGQILEETSAEVFIPITCAGGINSVQSAKKTLTFGADRICVNSAGIQNPAVISGIHEKCGAQVITVSIEAKRKNGGWEAYTDCGRNPSGRSVLRWSREVCDLGAGEILITSIDQDGTRKGPDLDLLTAIGVEALPVPVIYSGGIRLQDVKAVAELSDGMAIGASLHYGDCTIQQVKDALRPYQEIR